MTTTLISGASRGLGLQAARRLVAAGHDVYLGSRDVERGQANVSSAVGSLTLNAAPDAPWSALGYPMSKAALNMLTIQYARAFPRWRVNSVTPGLTNTEFIPRDVGAPVEEAVEIIVRLASITADGPTGTFQDVNGPLPW